MKRAFTLVEMLVVIAIIALLAAVLFPVFLQAKSAAMRTASISNQKQIGLGIVLYMGDHDDVYPRGDGCTLNDSLNPTFNTKLAGTNPAAYCSGVPTYAFRDNSNNWQKWILPYVKSYQVFLDPVSPPDPYSWNTLGVLESGYSLNTAITGTTNTWNNPKWMKTANTLRDSWLGGSGSGVQSPAETMLLMEQPFQTMIPSLDVYLSPPISVSYPLAIREHWIGYFYQSGGQGPCGAQLGVLDQASSPDGGRVPLSYADGHVKAKAVGDIINSTPPYQAYGLKNPQCSNGGSLGVGGNGGGNGGSLNSWGSIWIYTTPTWSQPWPLWGLQ